jgi:hypothetical protein
LSLTACGTAPAKETDITTTNPCGLQITDGVIITVSDQAIFEKEVGESTNVRFGKGIVGIANGGVFQDNAVFNNINKSKTIEFNSIFTSFGTNAFSGCTGITSVRLQRADSATSLVSFQHDAFNSCTNLETIAFVDDGVIPEIAIGNDAFRDCKKLSDFVGATAKSIKITAIGERAFYGCASLTYDMLDKIESVENTQRLADNTPSNSYIYFKSNNTDAALSDAGCLAYGEIASLYNYVHASAFAGCASITKITNCKLIVNGADGSIGQNTFADCTSLQAVEFRASEVARLNIIGSGAFQNCSALVRIDLGNVNYAVGLSVGANAFTGCHVNGQV